MIYVTKNNATIPKVLINLKRLMTNYTQILISTVDSKASRKHRLTSELELKDGRDYRFCLESARNSSLGLKVLLGQLIEAVPSLPLNNFYSSFIKNSTNL